VIVRAFVPHAEFLDVVTCERHPRPLQRRHDAGVFEGFIAKTPPCPSPIASPPHAGRRLELDDPYRFGPTLGPLDDHLLVEGTHRRCTNASRACLHA
jgi:1,4-alpha-glucan branching enzyme